MKKVLNILLKCIKFILGWIVWITILLLSLIFNTITWNWKETYTQNMETIITEICGESTWKIMTFK